MTRNLRRLALAAAIALAASSAYATEPLIAKLSEANDAVKNVAPQFGCYDQTDRRTCQQIRYVFVDAGTFFTFDFADGEHNQCFSPAGISVSYRVCSGDSYGVWAEVLNGTRWAKAPLTDVRCDHWGGPFTAEYLACEVALPPKTE